LRTYEVARFFLGATFLGAVFYLFLMSWLLPQLHLEMIIAIAATIIAGATIALLLRPQIHIQITNRLHRSPRADSPMTWRLRQLIRHPVARSTVGFSLVSFFLAAWVGSYGASAYFVQALLIFFASFLWACLLPFQLRLDLLYLWIERSSGLSHAAF